MAGLGFGGFFILISRSGGESGLWPIIAARSAGIMDIAANLFFILAAGSGGLITPSIIVGLHPAPTVLLQRIIFREKLGRLRTAGVIAALAGIVLIGMD